MQTNYGELPLVVDPTTGRAKMVQAGKATLPKVTPARGRGALEKRTLSVPNPMPAPTSGAWLSIVVMGQPLGKPRMTRRDKWKQRPTVIRYRQWCDQIRQVAGWTKKDNLLRPTKLTVRAYLAIPATWSALVKLHAAGMPHLHKPDIDNICKGVLDALIENDQMVYRIECEKYWDNGNGPCTEISLT